MSQNPRILAIAPYQGLKSILSEAAKAFPNLSLEIVVGNLDEAEKTVRETTPGCYDVIISRGGTADLLKQAFHIPVVKIGISVLDMLRIIQTAMQSGDTFAIIGFDNITNPARILAEILHYDFPIIEIHGKEEVEQSLRSLWARDYRMIIGDVIAVETACAVGFKGLLVNSGIESVAEALRDAISLHNDLCSLQNEIAGYQAALNAYPKGIMIANEERVCLFQNDAFLESGLSEKAALDCCVFPGAQEQAGPILYEHNDRMYELLVKPFQSGGTRGCAIFIESSLRANERHLPFTPRHITASEKAYCLYDRETIRAVDALLAPQALGHMICIYGEPGTEHDLVAEYLHISLVNDQKRAGYFISVNPQTFRSEHWAKAQKELSDYARQEHTTIYIQKLQAIGQEGAMRLEAFINELGATRRCNFICATTKPVEALVLQDGYPETLYPLLCRQICQIPPLRERAESIPAICSMMVGTCNTRYGKQVVGFGKDAMRFLVEYSWPLNEVQLFNVIMHAVIDTGKAYIPKAELLPFLRRPNSAGQVDLLVDTSLTLDEMEAEIITHVLKRLDMNQSAAAQSLGMSRSTLWRKLK